MKPGCLIDGGAPIIVSSGKRYESFFNLSLRYQEFKLYYLAVRLDGRRRGRSEMPMSRWVKIFGLSVVGASMEASGHNGVSYVKVPDNVVFGDGRKLWARAMRLGRKFNAGGEDGE